MSSPILSTLNGIAEAWWFDRPTDKLRSSREREQEDVPAEKPILAVLENRAR